MADLTDYIGSCNKKFGEGTLSAGTDLLKDPPRIPFGIFPLDHALGGGIPIGQITTLKGKEDGGKSTLVMHLLAVMSNFCWRCFSPVCKCSLPPIKQKSFLCDAEHTFNPEWADCIGADRGSYVVGAKGSAEENIDIFCDAMAASDCGVAIIDSIAALTSDRMIEGSASDAHVGVDPRMITSFIKRMNSTLITEIHNGHPMAVVIVNQLRFKIGVLFGSPETTPGGQALRHMSSLWVRTQRKALTDADKAFLKKDPDKRDGSTDPVARHSFSIERSKIFKLAGSGEYVRAVRSIPSLGIRKGEVLDYNNVLSYGKTSGVVKQDDKGWSAPGVAARTQKELVSQLRADRNLYLDVQSAVIQADKNREREKDAVCCVQAMSETGGCEATGA